MRIGRGQPHALTAAASFLVGVVQHFETGGGLMVRDPRLVELVVRARALVVEARRKAGMPPIPGHFLDGTGLGAIGRF